MRHYERKGNAKVFLDRLVRRLEGGPSKVKVGFPAGEVGDDILARAVYNEFGTSRGIPERPFMRITMRENRDGYLEDVRKGLASVVKDQLDPRQVLSLLGEKAKGDIQRTISSGVAPPNAPSTVARKGSSTTLIDTGQMRQSVTWKIDE